MTSANLIYMIQNTCIASFITLMMIVIVTALWMTARWWGYREVGMKWRGRERKE